MAMTVAQPLGGPAAWRGAELTRTTDWIWPISAAAAAELDAALRAVKARGLAWRDIRRESFPLPGFAPHPRRRPSTSSKTAAASSSCGGCRSSRYSEDELRALYFGIGAHLGTARYQNSRGELIGEVRDEVRVYGEVQQPAMPDRGRGRAADLALQGALERAPALPHRPHRRGGAALRAPGAGGRAEQGGQLGGHSRRDARPGGPISTRCCSRTIIAAARARRPAASGARSRCPSGASGTDDSPASTRAPSSRPPSGCPACRRSPPRRTRRSISSPRWRRSSATR